MLYSGFQYRHDPGVPLVGIGAFVLLAGLIISFYFLPARLYVRVDDLGSDRCRVGVAATTVKGYDVFANEFARLMVRLERVDGMKIAWDELLLGIALAAYVLGALALMLFFFTRRPALRSIGAPLAIAGCVAQFLQLAVRFETTHVWPLLNLYGSLSLFSAMSVAIFIVFAYRYNLWFAGGFVLALAAVFLAYGVTWYEGTMPAVPSLQSYWAKIHVPIVVSSYSAFLVVFVFSCIYLLKFYAQRRGGRRGRRMAGIAARVTATRHHRLSRRRHRLAADFGRHHHRRDVGARGVGRVLAVGSERDGGALFLDRLPRLHASAHAKRLARAAYELGQRYRLPFHHLLLPRSEHLDFGIA